MTADAPSEVLVVDQPTGAWEQLGQRLREAPLIQELLAAARRAEKSEFGQQASKTTDRVKDRIEDVREAWETSQNPWVYRVSEIWDSLTYETDQAVAVRELRRLDPSFSIEGWRQDVAFILLPQLLEAWLRGDVPGLKPLMQPEMLNKMAHDIRQRKQERHIIDPNVLAVDYAEVIIDPALTDKQTPLLGLFAAVQQINCVRNPEGEVVQGAEDDIILNKYSLVLQREYDETEGVLEWKVVEFAYHGEEPMMI